jgi:hypothetical protein
MSLRVETAVAWCLWNIFDITQSDMIALFNAIVRRQINNDFEDPAVGIRISVCFSALSIVTMYLSC